MENILNGKDTPVDTEQPNIEQPNIEQHVHLYGSWLITTPPDFAANINGEETRTCSVCGIIIDRRTYQCYKTGDTGPAGGKIVYVADGLGGRQFGYTVQGFGSPGDSGYFASYTAYYLEAAPSFQGAAIWCTDTTLLNVTTFAESTFSNASLIGNGRKDTQTIVKRLDPLYEIGRAAQLCVRKNTNGYTDWFLPSLGELSEMQKAYAQGKIQMELGFFWSSSQGSADSAWNQHIGTGSKNKVQKNYNFYTINVHAIRAF